MRSVITAELDAKAFDAAVRVARAASELGLDNQAQLRGGINEYLSVIRGNQAVSNAPDATVSEEPDMAAVLGRLDVFKRLDDLEKETKRLDACIDDLRHLNNEMHDNAITNSSGDAMADLGIVENDIVGHVSGLSRELMLVRFMELTEDERRKVLHVFGIFKYPADYAIVGPVTQRSSFKQLLGRLQAPANPIPGR